LLADEQISLNRGRSLPLRVRASPAWCFSSFAQVMTCWGCSGGSGPSCSVFLSSGRCGERAGHCTTGRVERQFDLPDYPGFYSLWRRGEALLPTLARAGIPRVFGLAMGAGSLPSDASRQAREFSASPRELRADRVEFDALRTVFRQDKALTSLGRKPLFVLTADLGQQSGWSAAQRKLATLSTNSVRQTTHATHMALLEDERFAAVSARAIGAVVRSVRTSAKVAL
jgi:hypothetical protein